MRERKKKIKIVALIIFFMVLFVPARKVVALEKNNKDLKLNEEYSINLRANKQQVFNLVIDSPGRLEIEGVTNFTGDINIIAEYKTDYVTGNLSGKISKDKKYNNYAYVTPGTYQIIINSNKSGEFKFKFTHKSMKLDNSEPNVTYNKETTALISGGMHSQSYNFKVNKEMRVQVEVTSYSEETFAVFLDNIKQDKCVEPGDWEKGKKTILYYDLEPGTYEFRLSATKKGGKYKIKFVDLDPKVTEKENNDTMKKANSINLGDNVRGFIGKGDKGDNYKFTLKDEGTLDINFISNIDNDAYVQVFNQDGKKVAEYEIDCDEGDWTQGEKKKWTLNLKDGIYYIKVKSDNTGKYNFKLNFTVKPIELLSFEANKESGQVIGTIINFNAKSDLSKDTLYEFYVYENGKWIVKQKYSNKSTFQWKPSKEGIYKIRVKAKHKNSNKSYDSYKDISFKIYKNNEANITKFSADKKSGQILGNTIRFTANSNISKDTLYEFLVYENNKWVRKQSYSTKNIFDWKPTKDGEYKIRVRAKHKNSKKTYDSYKDISFKINKAKKSNVTSFTLDKSTKKEKGSILKFIANSDAGKQGLYEFVVYENGKAIKKQAYSTNRNFSWKATKKGKYTIRVKVKNMNSEKNYDSYKDIVVNIK